MGLRKMGRAAIRHVAAAVRCQHWARLTSASSVHLVANGKQVAETDRVCVLLTHLPFPFPTRHPGGWHKWGGGGEATAALVWGPLAITPKTAEMVAWSCDCRKTACDQSLCQPGSLPMVVRLWCSHSYKATIIKVH